jgi:hypothetical protein
MNGAMVGTGRFRQDDAADNRRANAKTDIAAVAAVTTVIPVASVMPIPCVRDEVVRAGGVSS